MKRCLIIVLSMVLMACSNVVKDTDNLSLIERISWIDDSKEVESFKKETLTAYEDVTIGEGMASETIEEWKYGIEDNNTYLMCKYSVDKKKEIIIFYKDNYDNINIAEYYIDDTKQDKDVIKAFAEKYFIKEEETTKEEANTDTTTKKETISTKEDTSTTETDTTKKEETNVKGQFEALKMIPEGTYYNSPEGGVPDMCQIDLTHTSGNSFQFTIYRIYDSTGNSCKKKLLSGEAMFPTYDARSAIYETSKYKLYFYCDYYQSFNLSGYDSATKAGDLFSHESGGSLDFGI